MVMVMVLLLLLLLLKMVLSSATCTQALGGYSVTAAWQRLLSTAKLSIKPPDGTDAPVLVCRKPRRDTFKEAERVVMMWFSFKRLCPCAFQKRRFWRRP